MNNLLKKILVILLFSSLWVVSYVQAQDSDTYTPTVSEVEVINKIWWLITQMSDVKSDHKTLIESYKRVLSLQQSYSWIAGRIDKRGRRIFSEIVSLFTEVLLEEYDWKKWTQVVGWYYDETYAVMVLDKCWRKSDNRPGCAKQNLKSIWLNVIDIKYMDNAQACEALFCHLWYYLILEEL